MGCRVVLESRVIEQVRETSGLIDQLPPPTFCLALSFFSFVLSYGILYRSRSFNS